MESALREPETVLERDELGLAGPADQPDPALSMGAWLSIWLYVFGVIVGVCIGWLLWASSWI